MTLRQWIPLSELSAMNRPSAPRPCSLASTAGNQTTAGTQLGPLRGNNRGLLFQSNSHQLQQRTAEGVTTPRCSGLRHMVPPPCLSPALAGQYQALPICPGQTLARKQVVPGLGLERDGREQDSCCFLEASQVQAGFLPGSTGPQNLLGL